MGRSLCEVDYVFVRDVINKLRVSIIISFANNKVRVIQYLRYL